MHTRYSFNSYSLSVTVTHPLSMFRKKIEDIPEERRHRLLRLLKPRYFHSLFFFPFNAFVLHLQCLALEIFAQACVNGLADSWYTV